MIKTVFRIVHIFLYQMLTSSCSFLPFPCLERHAEYTAEAGKGLLVIVKIGIQVHRTEILTPVFKTWREIPSRLTLCTCMGSKGCYFSFREAVQCNVTLRPGLGILCHTPVLLLVNDIVGITVQSTGCHSMRHPESVFFFQCPEHSPEPFLVTCPGIYVRYHHAKIRWLRIVPVHISAAIEHLSKTLH